MTQASPLHPSRSEPPRLDPFSRIFKAQRYAMCEALMQSASLDGQAQTDVNYVLGQVCDMLRYCDTMTRAIGMHVLPRIAAQASDSADRMALRGEERLVSIAWLANACEAAAGMRGAMRREALAALQQALCAFVARVLNDMVWIGSEANRELWSILPDRELAAIEEALLGAPEPVELRYSMQWMIPAIDPAERVELFAILRRLAGAEPTAAILAMSRDLLPRDESEALLAGLARARPD